MNSVELIVGINYMLSSFCFLGKIGKDIVANNFEKFASLAEK